ncbi:hypothetical protein FDUTEX481_04977 [Tolypothrix sp. PCC 7601]|nr:hypothetical protein FDUTEX481_04977 [Tolypothrix sp. PCC 7601]
MGHGAWGMGEAVRCAGFPRCSNCRHWALVMRNYLFSLLPFYLFPLAPSTPSPREQNIH